MVYAPSMARYECSVLVPISEDTKVGTGKSHPPQRWQRLQDMLEEAFRGWTIAPGRYHGMWLDDQGQPCTDKSRKYIVDVDGTEQARLLAISGEMGKTFRQRSMRVVVAGEIHYVPTGL